MDSKTIERDIKEGLMIHKPNESKKGSGKFWSTFDKIYIARHGGADEIIKEFVICRICKKIMKYDSKKGISNLNVHSDGCKTPKQTLQPYITRENIIRHDQKRELCLQTVAASVNDLRPFCLTNGSGMVNLIHCVWNMGAKVGAVSRSELMRALPCPTTVSRNVNHLGEQSKNDLKLKLKREIDAGTTLALTTDIWQDKHKRISYFCITIHYFDRNAMKLVDFILAMCSMEVGRRKDNTYLRQIIDDKLIEHGLAEISEKLVFVSDRGGNIRLALKDFIRLNCFPHFCHNIVKYGCEVDCIKQLIKCCAALVKYFKFNGLNNLLKTSLKSAISTRFNYIFMMLCSIDKEWTAIEQILTQRHELRRLTCIDRQFIKNLMNFLSLFNTASKVTESTYKETLAHVWIGVTQICSICRVQSDDLHYIKAIKARSLEYVESKFILHQYHRISTFLHPNYKSLVFCPPEQKAKTIRDTKNMLEQMFSTTQSSTVPSNSSSSRSSSDSASSFLSDYFNPSEDQLNEVDSYINLRWNADGKIDVFDWWIERKGMFPNLYKIALKMHSIPASSMQSERTFSRGGLIINDRRSSLNPKTVENLILLNKNFDFEVKYFFIYK